MAKLAFCRGGVFFFFGIKGLQIDGRIGWLFENLRFLTECGSHVT